MEKTAKTAYLREFGASMLAYLVILLGSITLLNNMGSTSPWRIPLTLVPMVPLVGVLIAVLRWLRRVDELERQKTLEALGFAFAGTALVTFSYGFLQNVGFPQVSWFFVWPVMAMLWLIGRRIANRRYR
jgi:hypothetical protein